MLKAKIAPTPQDKKKPFYIINTDTNEVTRAMTYSQLETLATHLRMLGFSVDSGSGLNRIV